MPLVPTDDGADLLLVCVNHAACVQHVESEPVTPRAPKAGAGQRARETERLSFEMRYESPRSGAHETEHETETHATETTMHAIVGFYALLEIAAPVTDARGRILDRALPARVFRCAICGYLELYDAAKTASAPTTEG